MSYLKRRWWLILIVFIISFELINISLDLFISKYQFENEDHMVLVANNGSEYLNHSRSMWLPIECEKRIGTIKGWEKYSNLWSNVMLTGVYDIKNDNNMKTLIVKEPLSEFTMYYHRSDVVLPNIQSDNIQRIEIINECFPPSQHKTCNNGTTDYNIINDFVNIIIKSTEKRRIQEGASCSKTILMYSDKLPGNAFNIPVWEKDNEYFLEYYNSDNLIKVSKEMIDKISGCNTK